MTRHKVKVEKISFVGRGRNSLERVDNISIVIDIFGAERHKVVYIVNIRPVKVHKVVPSSVVATQEEFDMVTLVMQQAVKGKIVRGNLVKGARGEN